MTKTKTPSVPVERKGNISIYDKTPYANRNFVQSKSTTTKMLLFLDYEKSGWYSWI